MATNRETILRQLLAAIRSVRPGERALVAIDGVDGAGKTHLADELVALADVTGNTAIGGRALARVSIDGFHHPRSVRYADGKGPEAFYRSSYDYGAFTRSVVEPFARGEAIVPAVWDVDADRPIPPQYLSLPADCVLIVDGIFLHRPELREYWDASVWVDVPFSVSVPRGNKRFPHLSDQDPESSANHRYVGGQRIYLTECIPQERATWILDNSDLDRPQLRTLRTD